MRWPVKRPFGGTARLDPFEEIRRTQERLNQFFEDYMPIEEWAGKIYTPAIDIQDEENKLVVTADLPGVNKEDIELNVKDDILEISAKCNQENETKEEGYLRRERTYTNFYRAIKLPSNVTEEEATAKMENGVLKITLPKLKLEEPKSRIQIE